MSEHELPRRDSSLFSLRASYCSNWQVGWIGIDKKGDYQHLGNDNGAGGPRCSPHLLLLHVRPLAGHQHLNHLHAVSRKPVRLVSIVMMKVATIVRKLFELLVPHHWPSSSSRIKIALADTAIFNKKIIIIINNLDSFLMHNLFD